MASALKRLSVPNASSITVFLRRRCAVCLPTTKSASANVCASCSSQICDQQQLQRYDRGEVSDNINPTVINNTEASETVTPPLYQCEALAM